ncbi:MAG: cytochrome b N-terminal domain-containing protein, partial [Thermoanaerobaculia bacterium]
LGLAFEYRPTMDLAYADVLDLREASTLGWVSKLHYWGSQALIVVVWLHLVRMFTLGLYRSVHRRNWFLGVVLLVPILMLAATGARLPMDTHAVAGLWGQPPALSGTGSEPPVLKLEDEDLWGTYFWHCILLPGVAAALVFVHVRRARRAGVLPADAETG